MKDFEWVITRGMRYVVDSGGQRRATVVQSKYGNYCVAKIGAGRWSRHSCVDEAIHDVQMRLFGEPYAMWTTLGGRG